MINPPNFLPQPILPASVPDNGGNYGASNPTETDSDNSNTSSTSFSARLERAQSQQEPIRPPLADRMDTPDAHSRPEANQTDKSPDSDDSTTENVTCQTARDERGQSRDTEGDSAPERQTAPKKHSKVSAKAEAAPALSVPAAIAVTLPIAPAAEAIAQSILNTRVIKSEPQTVPGVQVSAESNVNALAGNPVTALTNPVTPGAGVPTPQLNPVKAQTSVTTPQPVGVPTKTIVTPVTESANQTVSPKTLLISSTIAPTQLAATASETAISTPKNPLAPVDSKAVINPAQGTDNAKITTQILTPKIASPADSSVSSPTGSEQKGAVVATPQPTGSNPVGSKPTVEPVITVQTASTAAKIQPSVPSAAPHTQAVHQQSASETAPDSAAATALSAQHLDGIDRMLTLKQSASSAAQTPLPGTRSAENTAAVAGPLASVTAPERADSISSTLLTLDVAAGLVPDPTALRLAIKGVVIAPENAENPAADIATVSGRSTGKSTYAPSAEAVQDVQRADTETNAETNGSGSDTQQETQQQAGAEGNRTAGNVVAGTTGAATGSVTAGTASGSANAGTQLDRAHIVSQVARHLEAMRLEGANDRGEVILHLTPDSLGSVHMTISSHPNGVVARIAVESSQVQQVLEGAREHLRGTLESRGLHLGKLEVTVGQQSQPDARNAFSGARDWSQPSEFGTGARRSSGSPSGLPVTETLMPPLASHTAGALASESRLDFRA